MGKHFLCSPGFLRILLIILNILFVFGSIALIGFGIYIQIDNTFSAILNKLTHVSNFNGQSLGYLAFIMIGGGVITFIISIVGCMGALWQKRCVLIIYSVILGILMILELVGFIMAFVYKENLGDVYKKSLSTVLNTALNTSDTKVLDAFAELEKSLKCCGVNGLEDYNGREPKNLDCYRYRNGCSEPIIELLNKDLPLIGTTLGITLLFELIGLISAIALAIVSKDSGGGSYNSKDSDIIKMISINRHRNYNEF